MSKATVKEIQSILGVEADGIAGRKTRDSLWSYCDEQKLLAVLPDIAKRVKVSETGKIDTYDAGKVSKKAKTTKPSAGDPVLGKITRVLAIFEMGHPEFLWGATYWYNDGPGNKRQCTLSMGFTESGALQTVLDRYIANGGKQAKAVRKYRPQIGKYTIHKQRTAFSALMKKCGDDPVMREAQVFVFQTRYLRASEKFCRDNGFVLPLSRLVFADSQLHSGNPALGFLRKRFSEVPPADGGNEKRYVKQYSEVRRDWLAGHSKKLLRATAKRPRFYLSLMDAGNWDLEKPIRLEGFII